MSENESEIEFIDYLNILWRRKWLIIIPTSFCVIAVAVICFLIPHKWSIDAILLPSKFIAQTEQGTFEEVMIVDPKQIAGTINEESYNQLIAEEFNIDMREFPRIRARNLQDTQLVRIYLNYEDIEKAKLILLSLFKHVKQELDKKIDVEIKAIDTKIANTEYEINQKKVDIQQNEIAKTVLKQENRSLQNKLKISEERFDNIIEEMKAVKTRIDEIEKQQKESLSEKKEGIEAISILLYSNEIQQNLRYYNTLDEKLSIEKINQEDSKLSIKENEEGIKQLDTQIEKLNNEIENFKTEIDLLKEQKGRIDYSRLIKNPTPSSNPIYPNKRLNVMIAGILGLFIFSTLAFFLEYLKKYSKKT